MDDPLKREYIEPDPEYLAYLERIVLHVGNLNFCPGEECEVTMKDLYKIKKRFGLFVFVLVFINENVKYIG